LVAAEHLLAQQRSPVTAELLKYMAAPFVAEQSKKVTKITDDASL
jgi:hypothetical protein